LPPDRVNLPLLSRTSSGYPGSGHHLDQIRMLLLNVYVLSWRRTQPLTVRESADGFLHGVLESATSFGSFVDLRPNYAQDRNSIEEFLPVIVFRVSTEADDGNERSYAFQMTPASLMELKSVIDDTFHKLSSLTNDSTLSRRLFFDESVTLDKGRIAGDS
jgi:hypothetical protein